MVGIILVVDVYSLDCFTDQNWYGDDNYQFLGQAAPERLVHADRTLSIPSPQFRTESPTLQVSATSPVRTVPWHQRATIRA